MGEFEKKRRVSKRTLNGRRRFYPGLRIMLIAPPMIFILLAVFAAYCAPRFLAYAERPVQSDAVILFVGNDAVRKKEALRLLDEGYARFLIIPASHQVLTRGKIPYPLAASGNINLRGPKGCRNFYEHTHIEVLYAKETMNAMALRSAIMVSSPYHMKRIRMISEKVFGEQFHHLTYVPTRYENNPIALPDLTRADWTFVLQEYLKIFWFYLYSPFFE